MSLPFRTVRALLNILPSPLVFPTLLAVAAPLVVSRALRAQAPAAPRPTPATGTPLRISGTLRSAESREVVRHARVVADRTVSVESNEEGVYFLTLAAGTHRLAVRAIGFAPFDTTIDLRASQTLDIALQRSQVTLATVAVTATSEQADIDPKSLDMSIARLDVTTLRQVPAALGEVDPIRSLTLLPGVSSSSDFTTAINVRGGGADQNLILLDEATIYNPAHILGFLSVFNSDAVDDATLYKGAIPPRFGGRLSSVVDLRQREGNANDFAGSATIGLLASRLAVEGPLKGKGSWLIAARRSYADLFAKASSDPDIKNSIAYFYDLNAKATKPLGDHGTLVASGFLGRDRFGAGDMFSAGWGNKSGTLRWNEIVRERLYSKVTLAASDYDYRLMFPIGRDSAQWVARVKSLDFKVDESLHLSAGHRLEFGLQGTLHGFNPGEVSPRGSSNISRKQVPERSATAGALYLGEEREFGERWALRYGARLSGFVRTGTATIFQYANNAPVVYDSLLGRYEPGVVVDSTRYGAGDKVKAYGAIEPRASVRFSLSEGTSVKASYARTVQYLHLASKTNSPTPLDVWEPAGPYLRPQRADQVAFGVQRITPGQAWDLSAEAFVKRSHDVVDFVDGADVILNEKLETLMLQGEGRAYGLELFARRQVGRTTGWVSYTLSRAEQRFGSRAVASSSTSAPGINGGKWYASPYDKTHDLSVVAMRPLSRKWNAGATFTFATGLPATYPESRYVVDGLILAEYGPRNAARLPAYHRLDLAFTRKTKRGELQLGVFNAYNRFNAQSISFRQSEKNPLTSEAVQLSVFGVVPSISYTRHF